ncbi:hypothetical protein INT47_002301 [Mucor saturninus]|uniref:Uncharacterized protein n=1 Tax=Mucor saturninus TaxID=64648 RepID=A0A8H7QX60_9FUNG|nr:hypothetical protein INT47_002301 [Mucor saturninus]
MSQQLNKAFHASVTSQDKDLCLDKFTNPPRTMYDEIGQEEQQVYLSLKSAQENNDWKSLVYRLQAENATLVQSLHETNTDLMHARKENEELQYFIQRQQDSANTRQDQLLDLIFQKQFLIQENKALSDSQKEMDAYFGKHHQRDPLFKWRSCVHALIAIQRFNKILI